MECKSLRESGGQIREFDVVYFAASVDAPETNRKFAESLGADYPLLSDVGKEIAKAYGVLSGGREFAARWTFYIGVDGTILCVDRKVKPPSAGVDIAAKLSELGIARKR